MTLRAGEAFNEMKLSTEGHLARERDVYVCIIYTVVDGERKRDV